MAVSAIDDNNGGRRSNVKEKRTSRKKLSVEDEVEMRRRTTPTVLCRNAKNNEGIETPRSRNAKSSEEDGITATHKKKIEEADE